MKTKTLFILVLTLGLTFALSRTLFAYQSLPQDVGTQAMPFSEVSSSVQDESTPASTGTTSIHRIYIPSVMLQAPHCEEPYLAWASSEDTILLRWHTDACTRGSTFNVLRNGVVIAQDIQPVTDETEALAMLGSDWDWITKSYPEITSIAQLHVELANDPMRAEWLANQRYRVAQVLGWAYLDTAVQPGVTYAYTLEGVRYRVTQTFGSAQIQAGRITPFEAPTGLTNVDVIHQGLRNSNDWASAQINRKADRLIYLIWDIPTSEDDQWPEVWEAGYDVFRAPQRDGPYERVNLQWDSDDQEVRPVLPMPVNQPDGDFENLEYPEYEFFFIDEDPRLEYGQRYYYRVAPRDLLGQSRRWPTDSGQFSDYIEAIPQDTMPPLPPTGLTVTPLETSIHITWTPLRAPHLYRLYRTTSMEASILVDDCPNDSAVCWHKITQTSTASFTDTTIEQGVTYWYRVRALDAAGNLSAFSNAVPGVIHDNEPPCPPTVIVEGTYIQIYRCPTAPDVQMHQVYCSFDGGPLLLIQELEALGDSAPAEWNMSEYYTPPYPMEPMCQVQSVDAHGNRSELTSPMTVGMLCPAEPISPATPIINQISTRGSGTHDWSAFVEWDTVITPMINEFRIERTIPGEAPVVWVVSANLRTFLDDSVQWDRVYTYTVTAVQDAYVCQGESYPQMEAQSAPYLFKIHPPLPSCCGEPDPLSWYGPQWQSGVGTHLTWRHPNYQLLEQATVIVWRSLEQDNGYVALTPPIWAADYVDTSARHPNFWYMVTMLSRVTGEIIAQTPPWYAGSATTSDSNDASLALVSYQHLQTSCLARVADKNLTYFLPLEELSSLTSWRTQAVADTEILEFRPNANFGQEEEMQVLWQGAGETGYSLVRFDLEGLPTAARIHTAMLELHLNPDEYGEPVDLGVHPITGPWDELNVTWNNQPPHGSLRSQIEVGTDPGWYIWDVTTLVRDWYYEDLANHGLLLRGPLTPHVRTFSTREGADVPSLLVYYTPPPSALIFGTGSGEVFEVVVEYYDPSSRPDSLTGSGILQLGGGSLPVLNYPVDFENIEADEEGVVIHGQIELELADPIELHYPGGLRYAIHSLQVDETRGWGDVQIHLPGSNLFLLNGEPIDDFILNDVTVHANLTFTAQRNWVADCNDQPPLYAFEMDPLPLLIVPQGNVAFNHIQIELSAACSQYRERLSATWTRPQFPAANANDGFLQNTIYTASPVFVQADGFAGTFSTSNPVEYSTAMPYGFELSTQDGVSFSLSADRLVSGMMHGVSLTVKYYTSLEDSGHPGDPTVPPLTGGTYLASAEQLTIGMDGAVYGTVTTPYISGSELLPIQWMNGNFILRNLQNTLYIAPLQTAMQPAAQAYASLPSNTQIQPGLNVVTGPGQQVDDFAWRHCGSEPAIRFPDGGTADLYLRRSGVSDFISATIPVGGAEGVDLYGYSTAIKTFRMSFCHNDIKDSDIEGDVDLPWPTDVIVPLIDMLLDQKACVESSRVREEELTLGYYQIGLHPTSAAFIPDNSDTWLWIYGALDVPHLTLARADDPKPIPLEISFTPLGTFRELKLSPDQLHYSFDGLDWLMEKLRLSTWHSANPEIPNWVADATLASPPSWTGNPNEGEGFLSLEGKLIAPYFSTLQPVTGSEPPQLRVLGWHNYVGFTQRPKAKRSWNLGIYDHDFDFDLLYVQDHSAQKGAFVGFRQDDWLVVEWDSGLVIAPQNTGIYLGLSSGTAVLRAMAQLQYGDLPEKLEGALRIKMENEWVPRIWKGEDTDLGKEYLEVLVKIWDDAYEYENTTAQINKKLKGKMPDDPTGGKTAWFIKRLTTLKHIRGAVLFEPVNSGDDVIDWSVKEVIVSTWFEARNPKSNNKLVEIDDLTFMITEKGEYILHGKDIEVKIRDEKFKGDAYTLIAFDRFRLEGSIQIKNLDYPPVKVEIVNAIFGVGEVKVGNETEAIAYLGALIEAKFEGQPWGGAVLFGAIYPDSPIFDEMGKMGFKKIFDDIGATGIESGEHFTGAYMRVYGSKLVYNKGCLFRIGVGGEVAAWYFDLATSPDNYWGGRLRGYIYGTAFCLLNARGDVSLQISHPGYESSTYMFQGNGWVAGGIGFCEPETWIDWNNRWWKDSWCYQCGARLEIDYNKKLPLEWNVSYSKECE